MRLPDRYPVFRQIPCHPCNPLGARTGSTPRLRHFPSHIVVGELDRPGDDETLRRYVSALMSRPLDRSKPLWEIHLWNSYRGNQRDGRPVSPRPRRQGQPWRVLWNDRRRTGRRPGRSGAEHHGGPDQDPPTSCHRSTDAVGSAHRSGERCRPRWSAHHVPPTDVAIPPVRRHIQPGHGHPRHREQTARCRDPIQPADGAVGVEKMAVWSNRTTWSAIRKPTVAWTPPSMT